MLLYNFHDYHLLVASYFIERMNLTLPSFLDIIYFHFLPAVIHMGTDILLCRLAVAHASGRFSFLIFEEVGL